MMALEKDEEGLRVWIVEDSDSFSKGEVESTGIYVRELYWPPEEAHIEIEQYRESVQLSLDDMRRLLPLIQYFVREGRLPDEEELSGSGEGGDNVAGKG